MIPIAVVDDNEVVRRGPRTLFAVEPGLEVVAEFDSYAVALAELPDGDGTTLCADDTELVDAIRAVAGGTSMLDPATTAGIADRFRAAAYGDPNAARLHDERLLTP